MGFVDKQKQKRRAERMSDPHGWADQMEQEAGVRSALPFILLIVCIFLAANVWLLWQQRDALMERIEIIEGFLTETTR